MSSRGSRWRWSSGYALDLPENLVATELLAALPSSWPKYLGYFLSFVVISTFWLIHHSIFRSIMAYDRGLLWLNFLF
jgi:uncharacterized membrane protein